MLRTRLFTATALALAWLPSSSTLASDAVEWQRWETSLTSSKDYTNEYRDVTVDVTYTGPNGETINTYGFWDGGNTFKIRAAFSTTGTWTWQTTASDTTNTGLHNLSGTVNVTAYTGDNALYQHGSLQVSSNNRYLTHADGTPFFYMADTPWIAPLRTTQANWQTYIDDRASKNFSAVQVSPAADWNSNATFRNVNGDLAFTTVDGQSASNSRLDVGNPAFWQYYEQMVEYANEQGLVFFMNGIMSPAIRGTQDGAVEAFARNIAGRLAGNHVIFAPNFDSDPWQLDKVSDFDLVGRTLQKSTTSLIATHPGTSFSPVQNSHAYSWLDISGVQSGHNNGNRNTVYFNARDWVQKAYNLTPTKPVINFEAFYDATNNPGSGGAYQGRAKDARGTAYLSVLSGAAGYGYGAYGIWNWEVDPSKPYYWAEALQYDSSDQMGYLVEFFDSAEWWKLAPRQDAIRNQPSTSVADWQQKTMVFALSDDGKTGVAYLPQGGQIRLDMSVFSEPITNAQWFDPITNEYFAIAGQFANSGRLTFTVPAGVSDDAVLLLRGAPEPSSLVLCGLGALLLLARYRRRPR